MHTDYSVLLVVETCMTTQNVGNSRIMGGVLCLSGGQKGLIKTKLSLITAKVDQKLPEIENNDLKLNIDDLKVTRMT